MQHEEAKKVESKLQGDLLAAQNNVQPVSLEKGDALQEELLTLRHAYELLQQQIVSLNLNEITPKAALDTLFTIKEQIQLSNFSGNDREISVLSILPQAQIVQ